MYKFKIVCLLVIVLLAACNLQVAPPDQTLETAALSSAYALPSTLTVPADSRTGIRVLALGFFAATDTVTLDLQNPPTGISLTNITAETATSKSRHFRAVLRVNASVASGNYVIQPRVTLAGVTKLSTINLTVTPAPANPTFKLTLSATNLELERNKTTGLTVFISRIKGFNQPIDLSIDFTGTPQNGLTVNPSTVAGAGFIGNLSIQTAANATPLATTFISKVKGISGAITKQNNLSLTIKIPSGELDPRFGNNGMVVFNESEFTEAALQSNDKLIVARLPAGNGSAVIIRRYTTTGAIDSTFGINGQTSVSIGAGNVARLMDLAVDPNNNKIIVAIEKANAAPSSSDFLIRLKANGQLDTGFGQGGMLVLPDRNLFAGEIEIQSDGKIIIEDKYSISRVLSDGSGLDPSFGVQGKSENVASGVGADFLTDIAIQDDGDIVVVGKVGILDSDGLVAQFFSNGFLDDSFDGDGILHIGFGTIVDSIHSVALSSQQKIVALGEKPAFSGRRLVIAQVLPSGTLDTTFSQDGKFERGQDTLGIKPWPTVMALQSNDRPLIVIQDSDNFDTFMLIRQTTSGALDTSFSTDGKVTLPNNLGDVYELLLDSKGQIVVVGHEGIARLAP